MCVCVYSHSVGLFKLADLLDLVHEISAIYVLHDKIQAVLWTDGGEAARSVKVRREVPDKGDGGQISG